jgi:hypothetical protein
VLGPALSCIAVHLKPSSGYARTARVFWLPSFSVPTGLRFAFLPFVYTRRRRGLCFGGVLSSVYGMLWFAVTAVNAKAFRNWAV